MGCETPKTRLSAVKGLLDMGFAGYASVTPQLPEGMAVPVKLGTKAWVQAVPSETGSLLVEKSQKNDVTTEVELTDQVSAPVSRGQQLGTVTVKVGQQVIKQYPLVAADTVPKLSWWDLVGQVFRSWCGGELNSGLAR
jgi:D-alanyl-D-alanine carboxypeptidase (penicillin-binding protein 5/6)